MSNRSKPSETDLSSLYQQRKSQTKAPSAIKRKVLQRADQKKPTKTVWLRFQYLAIAASTFVLFAIVYFQQYRFNHGPAPLRYTQVELHTMESESTDQFAHLNHQYQTSRKLYQQQQALMVAHHSKQAVLHRSDNGWEMQTCDQQLVAVSRDLIDKMLLSETASTKIKSGDSVDILFNQAGMIVSIRPAPKALICT